MTMDTLRFCPQCQQPLPNNAPEGLCPQCLMKAAAAPPSEPQVATTSGGGDIVDIGDPVAVGKCLPQFEILELLGRGGMGVVYKARQKQLDRLVALKILPPSDANTTDFVARFTREARSLAKLSHPNIVTVYDFGESGGLYYFIMEYVDGANLRQMMQAKQLTAPQALAIVPKICDALQFAHEEGVMHRDIKPENILLDKKGRVKIADFGLAKLLRREQADHTLTMSGMTLGTPRYMAPEQLDKPETVDHRADIYSLGVVFYEMLTGELPMGRFAPPSQKVQVDVRLDEIVLHALERDVERRYQHVSEIRTDVENVTGSPNVAATPSPQSAHKSAAGAPQPVSPPPVPPELCDKINTAGIFMLIAGIAIAVSGLIAFTHRVVMGHQYAATYNMPGNIVPAEGAGSGFEMLALTLCGIAILNGGIAMRKLRCHGFAFVMSMLLIALLPAMALAMRARLLETIFIQLAFGLYAGIRAFRLLRKPEVEAAFAADATAAVSAWRKIAGKPAAETPKPSSARAKMIALGTLAVCVVIALVVINQRGKGRLKSSLGTEAPIPPLGPITNGIGASFTVPAGQVAIFEVVTRRDNATVPVPPHCAFVLAPAEGPIHGTFLWSREPAQGASEGSSRRWKIEVVSGAGIGSTGGLLLPEALDATSLAMGLALGILEPNEQTDHLGDPSAGSLPANGNLGLRVTTVAHNLKTGGSGIGHTDWKGAKPKTKP